MFNKMRINGVAHVVSLVTDPNVIAAVQSARDFVKKVKADRAEKAAQNGQEPPPVPSGYHTVPIRKGVVGSISKIQEELDELKDAANQDNKIMEQVELSDLYGAIRHYLRINHPNLTMKDLEAMADTTERAFKTGCRK